MTPIYANHEIVIRLNKAQSIADRVARMTMERARQASREAGLHGDVGCALHNSLVSLEYGKPWQEVNYSKARLAKRLIEQSFRANQIVDNYYRRMVGLGPRS